MFGLSEGDLGGTYENVESWLRVELDACLANPLACFISKGAQKPSGRERGAPGAKRIYQALAPTGPSAVPGAIRK